MFLSNGAGACGLIEVKYVGVNSVAIRIARYDLLIRQP